MFKSFNQKVYEITQKIPKGKVATYGQVAKLVSRPKSWRIVGRALKENPNPIIVPCHRVIASDGSLGGYQAGLKKKVEILKKEDIEIKNGRVDLKRYGWKKT